MYIGFSSSYSVLKPWSQLSFSGCEPSALYSKVNKPCLFALAENGAEAILLLLQTAPVDN